MNHPWNNCNSETKAFYYPVEAAIRWCGLMEHEAKILGAMNFPNGDAVPKFYPEWPCLRQRTELIHGAIESGELPAGRNGQAPTNEHITPNRRTVRHGDLKDWVYRYHHGDKLPPFLFDETERKTHASINGASFLALQVEVESQRAQLARALEWYNAHCKENEILKAELYALRAKTEAQEKPLDPRERTTLLIIIAALCNRAKLILEHPYKDAKTILNQIEQLGVTLKLDTIAEALKATPEAVASRKKDPSQ